MVTTNIRKSILWLALVISALIGTPLRGVMPQIELAVTSVANVAHNPMRLRFSWGGGNQQKWRGHIRFVDAEISNPAVLGFSPQSSAAINVGRDSIDIGQLTASHYEGIDVDVHGRGESKVQIELQSEGLAEPVVREILLSKLIAESSVFALDTLSNRFSITRAPGDTIQFKTQHSHLIFTPRSTLSYDLRCFRVSWSPTEVECQIELLDARTAKRRWSETKILTLDQTGSTSWQQLDVPLPDEEGVYDLRWTISKRSGSSLLRNIRPSNLVRQVQLVVVSEQSDHRSARRRWQQVLEIDPRNLKSSLPRQLNQFSRIMGLRSDQAAGVFDVNHNVNSSSVELPVNGWQAIPLDIAEPGQPHLIEIEYDWTESMALGMSILQADETGQIPDYGIDSGLTVPKAIVGHPQGRGAPIHRFTFWPSQERVVLLIANRSESTVGGYRRIRLLRSDPNQVLPHQDQSVGATISNRRLMAFYELPLFPENFAAEKWIDPTLGQPINDWVTFYQGTERLVDHLKEAGAGGAFINVLGEGSSLMPLKTLLPSSRFDSGVFSAMAADPLRKDVIELMYRMFEREGLWLIPVVCFDQPLASIEFATELADARVIDYRGRQRVPSPHDQFPVYNPLSPTVQQAVSNIVSEVVDRYRSRPNYRGIALVCRPDTMTLLPGSRFAGYDERTIARFAEDTNADADLSSSDVLLEETFPQWLDWRSRQMSRWYRQLGQVVSGGSEQAKLYLALVDVFRNEEVAGLLSPSLHRTADVSDAMLRLGLRTDLLQQNREVVLMKPNRVAPLDPWAMRKSEFFAQRIKSLDQWFSKLNFTAHVFSHRSRWTRFENLEDSSFFREQRDPIVRLQQLSPAGQWNRERFARAVLDSDTQMVVDGGTLLSTNIDPSLRQLIAVYSLLPDQRFATVEHAEHVQETHPIAVRYLNVNGQTYCYLVNGSPWQIDATVTGNTMLEKQFTSLDDGNADFAMEGSTFRVTLPPFSLLGGKWKDRQVQLTSFEYRLPETAHRDLNSRYYQLRSKLIAAGSAKPIMRLRDPGFESSKLNVGWTTGDQQPEFCRLKQQNPFRGKQAIHIDNTLDRSVWIRSHTFVPPVTGRLSLSVWLKTSDASKQPPLRLSIESSDSRVNYYRFGEVGALTTGGQENQVTTQWKRFVVHFDDLPQEELSGLRVGLDMMGSGSVWVDDLQLYDRWLDENDSTAMTQLLASIGPLLQQPEKMERCRRILNSYWPTFLHKYLDDDPGAADDVVESPSGQAPQRSSMRQRFRRFVSPGIFQY